MAAPFSGWCSVIYICLYSSQCKEWSCTNSLGGMCVVDNTYAFGDDIKNGIS